MFLTNDGLSRIWHNTRLGRAGPSGQVARVSWVQTGGGRHNTPACIAMWQSSHGHHQPAQPELQPRKIFNICPKKYLHRDGEASVGKSTFWRLGVVTSVRRLLLESAAASHCTATAAQASWQQIETASVQCPGILSVYVYAENYCRM